VTAASEAALQAAGLWTALHLLLLLGLSLLAVRQRFKHRVRIGDGGVPEVERALRAFGNAAEYVPPALAALILLALLQQDPRLVHGLGATLFVARVAHAIGLSRSSDRTLGRTTGVVLTWAVYLAAAGLLLFSAL
jgi:hypothetical protein